MNERTVGEFLQAVRRLVRQVGLYPEGHPLTDEAVAGTERAVRSLAEPGEEVLLSLAEDAFYLNRVLLPHASLEYNGLLREMQQRGIYSLTVRSPVSGADLYDLAAYVAAQQDDLPADGTIRLNETLWAGEDGKGSVLARLRRSYTGSLDALRLVNNTMASDGAFDLNAVTQSVEGLFEESLDHSGAALLLSTVKSHDEYTFYHSVNTCLLSIAMGRLVGIDKEDLVPIGVGAALHDIGKVAVSSHVLNKPGRLDEDDWREVEIHPQEGAQAILAASGPGHEIAATVALEHHARFDGRGYPKLGDDHTPHFFSRLVAVGDIYDAITTRRAYRRAETPTRALQILIEGSGSAYDPDLVEIFVRMMGLYPPGSIVRLRSGTTAMVTKSDETCDGRLEGVLVRDAAGDPVDPEPIMMVDHDVVEHLLPDRAGVDPATVMATLETEEIPA